jgi:hypothetical protein
MANSKEGTALNSALTVSLTNRHQPQQQREQGGAVTATFEWRTDQQTKLLFLRHFDNNGLLLETVAALVRAMTRRHLVVANLPTFAPIRLIRSLIQQMHQRRSRLWLTRHQPSYHHSINTGLSLLNITQALIISSGRVFSHRGALARWPSTPFAD